MKKQPHNPSNLIVYILISFLVVCVYVCSWCSFKLLNNKDSSIVDKEYLHGYKLDIPEELTAISDTTLMRVYKKDSTIVIEFDNN